MVIWLQRIQDENGWVSVLKEQEEEEKNFRQKRNIWKAIGGEEQWREKLRTAHETKTVFYLPCLLIKGVFGAEYKTHL